MTDQVSSGNGQHQRWAASSKHLAASEGSGWQQGGSRVAAGWGHWLTMGGVVLLCCWGISHWQMAFVMMCWMWYKALPVIQWLNWREKKKGLEKDMIQTRNVYIKKNQKDVTHRVIRCAEKHCRWDNNENDAQESRNLQKICLSQRNVYLGRN